MSDCKMSRVSRELFNNIKSFLHHKLKTMIRIQSVNDLQLVVNYPTAKAIGLFLAS
ncbi:hypothetical protein JT217_00005 [Helicobacter pylori]|nr:hypothetical protein [Helicobacter pylori]